VQVDPIKPTLKAPGTERLKLKYEEVLSNVGFKINLRRYSMEPEESADSRNNGDKRKCVPAGAGVFQTLYHKGYLLYLIPVIGFTFSDTIAFMAEAYTCPLLSSA